MTTPSKLDEARLRELADELRTAQPIWNRGPDYEPLMIEPGAMRVEASQAILALLDVALSAERERGDRAVGLLRPFGAAADFWEPLFPDAEPMMKPAAFIDRWRKLHGRKAAVPQFTVGDLKDARAFLATQKAEGATSTPATKAG